jgi:hypothetical protein
VNPDQPWIVEQHLTKPTDPAIHIEWHTTCFSGNTEYCGEPVRYAVTFYVRAPEDVDLRDSGAIITNNTGTGAEPPALVFPIYQVKTT